ncbi:MAG: Fur family transcriptional regulator [Salibacteraceae bacterium]
MKDANEILKAKGLRTTASRSGVLEAFRAHHHALSHSDLEKRLGKAFDRVTLYRTLNTFLEKDIIHKVLDDEGSAKYALCQHSDGDHHHNHVHFKCRVCTTSECLTEVSIPGIKLPEGYTSASANLLIEGVCIRCYGKE